MIQKKKCQPVDCPGTVCKDPLDFSKGCVNCAASIDCPTFDQICIDFECRDKCDPAVCETEGKFCPTNDQKVDCVDCLTDSDCEKNMKCSKDLGICYTSPQCDADVCSKEGKVCADAEGGTEMGCVECNRWNDCETKYGFYLACEENICICDTLSCGNGQICVEKECLPGYHIIPCSDNITCNGNGNCINPSNATEGCKCTTDKYKPPFCLECLENSDCENGKLCEGNICIDKANEQNTNNNASKVGIILASVLGVTVLACVVAFVCFKVLKLIKVKKNVDVSSEAFVSSA